MKPSKIRRFRANLERRSILMVFLARHMLYVRTITFITCGAVKMSPKRFLLADGAAALISAPLMMSIGYLASENFEEIFRFVDRSRNFLALLVLVAVVIVIVYRANKRVEER